MNRRARIIPPPFEELRAMAQHLPTWAIAERYGVSETVVLKWRHLAGVAKVRVSPRPTDEELRAMAHLGSAAIARRCGVTQGAARRWCREAGIETMLRKPAPSAEELAAMVGQGMTLRQIAAKYGLSHWWVHRLCVKAGIKLGTPGRQRGSSVTAETRARMRAARIALYADPEYRARWREGYDLSWVEPDKRTIPAELRHYYRKMRACGVAQNAARAGVAQLAAQMATP